MTSHLKNQTIVESNYAVFECNLNRTAYTNGIWMFNGKPITTLPNYNDYQEQAKYQMKTMGTKQVLVIRNVQPSDEGSYSFQGRNCFLNSTAKLTVQEIEMYEVLKDIKLRETNSVKFSVTLSHDEVNPIWTHNSRNIQVC